MKVGICKLGIFLSDIDLNHDTNGRFNEMVALKEIFEANGHQVELIDKNTRNKTYDKIFMLNGLITQDSMFEINAMRKLTNKIYYILTDLRLINENISSMFDIVYTQTKIPIPFIKAKQFYNGMPELAVYCSNMYDLKTTNKDIEFIFGGGERDRKEDFRKYFSHNDKTFRLLIKSPSMDTRVPLKEYHKLLARSKYSLVINDKLYNKYGFITWRYYENIANDVITFLDNKVDAGHLIKLPFHIRKALEVENYQELKRKLRIIEDTPDLKELLLNEQRKLLTKDIKEGLFTYNKLQREV